MKLRQYYLLKLIEECAEVSQRAAKQMQFGAAQTQAGDGQASESVTARPLEHFLSNKDRLSEELSDLLTTAIVLEEMGELDADIFLSEKKQRLKVEKIKKYLKYSQELGMVEHD